MPPARLKLCVSNQQRGKSAEFVVASTGNFIDNQCILVLVFLLSRINGDAPANEKLGVLDGSRAGCFQLVEVAQM